MESTLLGLVVDSDVWIGAERRKITADDALADVRRVVGNIAVILSPVSMAEIGHGIYRAPNEQIRSRRRAFLDDLVRALPVHPFTAATAEIVARVMGEEAARGINLPITDVMIAACAIELGYAVGTGNLRDFSRIPDLQVVHL